MFQNRQNSPTGKAASETKKISHKVVHQNSEKVNSWLEENQKYSKSQLEKSASCLGTYFSSPIPAVRLPSKNAKLDRFENEDLCKLPTSGDDANQRLQRDKRQPGEEQEQPQQEQHHQQQQHALISSSYPPKLLKSTTNAIKSQLSKAGKVAGSAANLIISTGLKISSLTENSSSKDSINDTARPNKGKNSNPNNLSSKTSLDRFKETDGVDGNHDDISDLFADFDEDRGDHNDLEFFDFAPKDKDTCDLVDSDVRLKLDENRNVWVGNEQSFSDVFADVTSSEGTFFEEPPELPNDLVSPFQISDQLKALWRDSVNEHNLYHAWLKDPTPFGPDGIRYPSSDFRKITNG